MYEYNCPDCNEAKLQSDKNARKINEVIGQVNALIQVNNETVDFIKEKASEIVTDLNDMLELKDSVVTEFNKMYLSMDNMDTEFNKMYSTLDTEKATKEELKVERNRIDNFAKLEEGSTTGDAELIDGRVGANGVIYKNLGSAIRNQNIEQSDKTNFFIDKNLYLESIATALENSAFTTNSKKIENLLNISGYEYNKDGIQIIVKNNTVCVNGVVNDFYYLKITNGFDIGFGPSGGNKKTEWCNEQYTLPLNQKYHLANYEIDGYVEYLSPDSSIAVSARNSDYTSILSKSKGLVELTEDLSYLQIYIPPATYNNYKIGVVLQKDVISTKFTPYGYYDTNVTIIENGDIVKDAPNNIIANNYKEIVGTHFNAIQGACTDGKYIYYGIVNNKTDGNNTVGKIDMNTKEIIKTTNDLSLGHCNSMTYCSYDGYIHCISLDEEGTIHRINTDLEYVDSYKVSLSDKYPEYTGVGAIDYNEKKEQFIFLLRGSQKGYAIFTKNITFIKIIWCEYVDAHAYGGICTDNNFIYQAICGNNFEGIISIFDFNGALIKTIQLENFYGEIEEPFLVKNKMYCSACRGDYTNHDIWELNLKNYQIV